MKETHATKRLMVSGVTLALTALLTLAFCDAANRLFLADPAADSYMRTAEEINAISIHDTDMLERLRELDAVTFDPSSGMVKGSMGDAIQALKLSDRTNVLLIGASQLAFVKDDPSATYHTRRVDQALKRLSNTPIEVYNLSAAGMNSAETMLVLEKATKRVDFDHVVVFLAPHVLQYRRIRSNFENMPDPGREPLSHPSGPSTIDRWLDPSSLNDYIGEWVLEKLETAVPFFRRRFPIQQWAARQVTRMEAPDLAGGPAVSTEEDAPGGQATLAINGGAGLVNPGLESSSEGSVDGWESSLPRPPVNLVTDTDLGKPVAVLSGAYDSLVLNQPVEMSGSPAGQTITLRARVKSSDPESIVQIGIRVGDTPHFACHPGDGAWHDLKVQYTFPYSYTNQPVTVTLAHIYGRRNEVRIADLALTADEPQTLFQYYYGAQSVDPILDNLETLLTDLEAYRERTGARITLVVSPYYQDPANPLYQPPWLEERFVSRVSAFAGDHGFGFLDARAILPNRCFGMHTQYPLIDAVHFNADGHRRLAAALAQQLGL